jgi:hypothetical protein
MGHRASVTAHALVDAQSHRGFFLSALGLHSAAARYRIGKVSSARCANRRGDRLVAYALDMPANPTPMATMNAALEPAPGDPRQHGENTE